MSRSVLCFSFGIQYDVLLFGVVANLQALCTCQKHPCTKDRSAISFHHDVGTSRQVFFMQPETKPKRMEQPTNCHLARRIFWGDPRHIHATGFSSPIVHRNLPFSLCLSNQRSSIPTHAIWVWHISLSNYSMKLLASVLTRSNARNVLLRNLITSLGLADIYRQTKISVYPEKQKPDLFRTPRSTDPAPMCCSMLQKLIA